MTEADKPDFMASVASDMPLKCLSIRQPWAWAIVHSNKRHENRSWGGWNNHQKRFRGPFCIHASSGMTRYEYDDAKDFMARLGVICPAPNELVRGAVIGTARVVDWVTFSHNAWFVGPGALVMDDVKALNDPVPCGGALGWFDLYIKPGSQVSPPAKWMLPREEKATMKSDGITISGQGRLL